MKTKQQTIYELEEKIYELEEKLHQINNWCQAYPINVFTELSKDEWASAKKGLASVKIKIDRISASNMRHVLKGIENIIK